jgi:glycine cleavage system T protein (aminomethyltransferase)
MRLADEVDAIRKSVTVARLEHVTVTRVTGRGAFQLVNTICPSALFLAEGQMCHTLLLSDDAQPIADVYVCYCDDQDLIVLIDGLSSAAFDAYIGQPCVQRRLDGGITLDHLDGSHVLFGINGPYAWELAAKVVGPEVYGMAYLSFIRANEVHCLRAGTTGEYGYSILVPKDDAITMWRRLLELGTPLGLRVASLDALDHCALENWHFYIRMLAVAPPDLALTPLELQLQWRVSYEKDFVGGEALRARRRNRLRVRATYFTAVAKVAPGQRIIERDRDVGSVLAAATSCTRGEEVGVALLESALAYPGIDRLVVQTADGPVCLLTRTPPLVNNRSLYVDPHRDSGQRRDEDSFPPLVIL